MAELLIILLPVAAVFALISDKIAPKESEHTYRMPKAMPPFGLCGAAFFYALLLLSAFSGWTSSTSERLICALVFGISGAYHGFKIFAYYSRIYGDKQTNKRESLYAFQSLKSPILPPVSSAEYSAPYCSERKS